MSKIILLPLVVLFLTGCNSIYYSKFRYHEVDPIKMIKNNMKRHERSSYVYLHFKDDSSSVYQLEGVHTSDTSFSGMIMNVFTEDALAYYEALKEKSDEEGFSRMRVEKQDQKINLDQLHFWIIDTIRPEINRNFRVNESRIRDVEKVKRFDKRWLWVIYGLLILLPIVLIIAAIVSINNMKIGPINISMSG